MSDQDKAKPVQDTDLDEAQGGFSLRDLGNTVTGIPGGDQFVIANGGGLGFQAPKDVSIPGGDQFIPGGDQFIPGGDQFNPLKRR